MEMQLQMCVII